MVVKLFLGLSFACFLKISLVLVFGGVAHAIPPQEPPSENSTISDIQIEIQDFYGNRQDWVEMVHSITRSYVRKGDRLSMMDIDRLAAALKECRRFQSIHLDTELSGTGLALIIVVKPFRMIKDIRIRGKYPLFEKRIFNAMTLYPGDPFNETEVANQSQLIAELYRQHGYIDPQVRIEKSQDPEDGHYTLDLLITKGRPYRLRTFEIAGNKAWQDSTLRWKMKSVRRDGKIFSEKKFSADLEKIKTFYMARGFADVVINHQLDRRPQTRAVNVLVSIDEGDRYDVSFVGNTAFGDRTLRKDLALFKSGNRRGIGLRKSIRNIKERYRRAGYAEIAVSEDSEISRGKDISIRRLNFNITEGPRTIVQAVVIAGNTVFSTKEIRKRLLTRPPGWLHQGAYVPLQLEEDIQAVESLYLENGYLNVEVEKAIQISADREKIEITLKIKEGYQTKASRIELQGLTAVPEAAVLKAIQIQVGRPFSYSKLKSAEKQIATMVSEKGYPYVQVSSEVVLNQDPSQVQVVFQVLQDSFIERGQTFYAGNFRTKERILERELVMNPGDPFSLQKMVQAQQNTRSMNIFRSVTHHPVGLKEKAPSIHLFTEVEEEKPFYFEAAGGYASEKGLYATSKIGDRNFWGLNKDARIGGEISETGYKGESRLFEPRFLGTRISSDLGLFFERSEPFNQTFGTDSLGFDLIFSRKWKKRIKGGLGFHFEQREQYRRDPDLVEDDAFDPRSILVVTPSISYDSRDSFMNPKEGVFALAGIDLSRGIENSLDDFYKYRTDLRGYITPINRLTFAGRGSFGKIEPYGDDGNVPDDQLFFLGGTSSVRGFDENLLMFDYDGDPVGSRLMAVGNLETRIDIGWHFELSFFYDIGYLDETSGSESSSDNLRDSIGIGLRYATPVGAVGLVYGHKLDSEPDESPGRLHFSIGYTF